jgi:hypothetical protein
MSSRKDFQNANRCKGQRQGEGEGSTAGWYLRYVDRAAQLFHIAFHDVETYASP